MPSPAPSPAAIEPGRSPWREAWHRLRQNRMALAGLIVLFVFALAALLAPWLSPQSYQEQNLALAWTAWEMAKQGEGYDHVETSEWPLLFVPWVLHRQRAPCTVQLHGSHGQITEGDPPGVATLGDGWVRLIECALLKEALAVLMLGELLAGLLDPLALLVGVHEPAGEAVLWGN